MDTQRLKDNFSRVAIHGDELPLFFYSDLFLRHPETRELFPVAMDAQRDRLVKALIRVVSDVDNLQALVPFLRGLGRDHRKFGALAGHYDAVGASLINALRHFSGPEWSTDLEADWAAAYGEVAKVMIASARDDEQTSPAWWDATVISHEPRSFDTAVFRVTTGEPLPYHPGQSVTVQLPKLALTWRPYSMANTPRADGTLDFHVRAMDGGSLSSALTYGIGAGSQLKLGPAVGTLFLTEMPARDLLLVAGGTGLAPLKAIVEQLGELPDPPQTHLYFGARTADGLYDLPDLDKMAARWPWLTVVPAVSEEDDYPGERGLVSDVAIRRGNWSGHDIYAAGPTAMVEATVKSLILAGVPAAQIHSEDFGWSTP